MHLGHELSKVRHLDAVCARTTQDRTPTTRRRLEAQAIEGSLTGSAQRTEASARRDERDRRPEHSLTESQSSVRLAEMPKLVCSCVLSC